MVTASLRATENFQVGFLVFPKLTQLDMTGPYEVLSRMPGCETHLIWKTSEPVESEHGLVLSPITSFVDCPPLDLICIPGGFGVNALLGDAEVLDFVRKRGAQARYVTSVCTGSLVLGAAGLLKGRRASSHWMSRQYLSDFGAIPVDERVVVDGNFITGGGVTAGIDFALTVVAEIAGADAAKAIQLAIEYNPSPPFDCGSPHNAPRALVESLREQWSAGQKERKSQVTAAAQRLATG